MLIKQFFLILTISTGFVYPDKYSEIFTGIYDEGHWGKNADGKGNSGVGSSLSSAAQYMKFLEQFLEKFNIKSVVDCGCGDWEFSKHMNWSGVHYKGYDVVQSVIDNNIEKFASKNIVFYCTNFIKCNLPSADLLICKDVLQHMPSRDIRTFLKQLGKFKFCLITNDILNGDCKHNINIKLGRWRPIDLSKPPFSLDGKSVFSYPDSTDGRIKQVYFISNENL